MVIWKYELEITAEQTIKLPEQSTVLSVCNQRDTLVLYAMVCPDVEGTREIEVSILGTNHQFNPIGCVFVGTVIMGIRNSLGDLVWHVFVRDAAIAKG